MDLIQTVAGGTNLLVHLETAADRFMVVCTAVIETKLGQVVGLLGYVVWAGMEAAGWGDTTVRLTDLKKPP